MIKQRAEDLFEYFGEGNRDSEEACMKAIEAFDKAN